MNPDASGAFVGLRTTHGPGELVRAVLEGVAFSLREGVDILGEVAERPTMLRLVAGPARSKLWVQILRCARHSDSARSQPRRPQRVVRADRDRMVGTEIDRHGIDTRSRCPRLHATTRYGVAYGQYLEHAVRWQR